mgnify:CR=1 FL=1
MNKNIITKSLSRSMNYQEYFDLIQRYSKEGKTSGIEQSENRISISKLNASRMRRLEKTVRLNESAIADLSKIKKSQTWLVIIESWCADGAQTIPVLNKIAEATDAIQLRIVFRDEETMLMDAFLTNGTRSIPKLIIVDEEEDLLSSWGPRSVAATELVVAYKEKHNKIDAAFKEQLQVWYFENKGLAIVEELLAVIQDIELNDKKKSLML